MQLGPTGPATIRGKLGAAACMLLASVAPAVGRADSSGAVTQVDGTLLLYGEQSRTKVAEPTVRVTRLQPSGRSLSGQVVLDVMTGATPTGAMPPGVVDSTAALPPDEAPRVQTMTAASGGGGGGGSEHVPGPGDIPLAQFHDTRVALDAEWHEPITNIFGSTLGGYYSREKDYESVGASGKLSLDFLHKLTTLTLGGGVNRDHVFPSGGTPLPLSDGTVLHDERNAKDVTSALVGLSRVITRRWLISVNGSRTYEDGYLTEPYKVVSLIDPATGYTTGQITEGRPSTRQRTDVMTTMVYHFTSDVLHLSHRYYWDDWGVRSNTIDLKLRHDTGDSSFLQPHLRYYNQSQADFFTFGLVQGEPLPTYATSDYRLGPLSTATVGLTYGFHVPEQPGEFTIRAEYILQFGKGHPDTAMGVQQDFDLMPPVNIGSLVAGYSVAF
ncbi:MAG TPA: DUF3570 domain-containing protein [Candidatus Eisenbacteria bacterium]|nr:DUF3570 domain-containing protein [Candidatus Eisenbacteria bacterium]